MEQLDPMTGATPDWEAFVASLDPGQLERERFGRPGAGERPGSPAWRRMVVEHDAHREAFYARPRQIRDYEMESVLVEVREYDRRFERHLTSTHLDIAERALRHMEGHAA